MNRNHSIKQYLEIINRLKEKNSSIKFSSDFIIAYPGETKDDFEKIISLVKEIGFINSYSFIFSPRPGTPAGNLQEVDTKIAKERLFIFQHIADEIKKNYRKKLINSNAKVLFENRLEDDDASYFGRDEYQNAVIVKSKKNIIGSEKNVLIKKISQQTIYGELIDTDKFLAA